MKRELLLTFALCFKVLCICEWKEDRETKWNSSAESWLEFHVNYCGRYCDGLKLEILKQDCENITPCFPCDCDPNCDIYDTCCPLLVNNSYVEPSFHSIDHLPNPDRFQCKSIPKDSNGSAYYIITDCDSTFLSKSYKFSNTKRNIVHLCRNPKTRTLDDITPYTDIYYGIVFANKFCAICNGYVINDNTSYYGYNLTFKIARPWTIEISCKHYQNLYHLTNEYEFFFAAAKSSQCKITLNPPPSKIPPKVCTERIDKKLKHVCTHQDSVEDQMCQNLPRRKYLQAGLMTNMANIFCFLCNGLLRQSCTVYDTKISCSVSSNVNIDERMQFPKPPIKMLLTLKKRNHFENDNTCISPRDWLDFQGQCQVANCTAGKIPSKDGQCITALSGIRGLAYKFALTLTPQDKVVMTETEIKDLNTAMYQKLRSVSSRIEMSYEVTMEILVNGSKILLSNTIKAKILANDKKNRDEFETEMIQIVTRSWEFTLASFKKPNITLNLLLGSEYHKPDLQNSSLLSDLSTRRYGMTIPEYIPYYSDFLEWPDCCDFIDVTYTLLCPYVAVNITNITVNMLDIHLSFNYDGRVIEVVGGPNISVVNGELHICLETFKTLIKTNPVQSPADIALYYFQIVCILFSVVCLVMSLVTYFLFSSLRTLPGLNNMCLCLSMLCAQVSLLLTVEFGVKGQLPPELCMFHAIFLHFSWLASFAWMSGCCIHMFLAFTSYASRRNDVTSDQRRHIRYCVYGFGVPLLIVVANVGVNASLTSGQSVGYDDTICFLDTRTSALTIVLTLLVPLCAMVFSNGVLFTLTLHEMIHVAKIQKEAIGTEGQGVMTYVKLSTLTGVFCIVAAVAVWLDSIVLQFLTCPLMTLQGVFIFFSFIFNKRVGNMYYDLFGLHRLGAVFTTQSSSSQSGSGKQTESKNRNKYSQSTSSTNI
ncbi:G-protein coupled receptor 64 [Biomphalaria glabrata]|nr:G-protein coupled receptor 64-like [Biomphalaria glabrata]